MNRFYLFFCWVFFSLCFLAKTADSNELSDGQFASLIKTAVVWADFPLAQRVVERVPDQFESARYMRAKVESSQNGPEKLTLTFRVGLSQDGDWSKIKFTGPLVTFQINRRIPIPQKEIVGKEISIRYNQKGELLAINLIGIGVTHVRKAANSKKLEAKVLIENDDMLVLFDENTSKEQRRRAIKRGVSFSFLPDKLALLDQDSTELMFFRVLQLVKGYGAVIQTMDTGPGMLELEGFELEAPPEWIAVGEFTRWGPIPPSQRTTNF